MHYQNGKQRGTEEADQKKKTCHPLRKNYWDTYYKLSYLTHALIRNII